MQQTISRRVFLALSAAAVTSAQDPDFSTDIRVVNLLATVHDKQNKIVSNLTKDDFEVFEDGRPQTVRYFSHETDLPLTLGLLVDTSRSQQQVLSEEKNASRQFIQKVLREERDQTFLIHFDREVELLQDLTSSRAKLEHALDDLQMSQQDRPQLNRRSPGGGGISFPGGGGRRAGGGGTALYDSILLASDDLMKKRQGRKAVILLTDGVDNGSKVPLSEAIESAQRADTLVYSILFAGAERTSFGNSGSRHGGRGGRFPQAQREHPDGKRVLEQISRETGGSFFEVSKKLSLDQIYGRIEEELRNQFSLGYTSDKAADAPGFRKISVTVKPKGLVVQTREGYYATR